MAKNNPGKALGAAAVTAGLAAIVAKLEEQAKAEGRDILDVAKEKIEGIVDDVKSGEAADKATALANKLADDFTSGEMLDAATEKFNNLVEDVKSGKIVDDATQLANNVYDGVIDILDGENANAEVPAEAETEEKAAE